MSDRDSALRARIKATETKLDRFERQAVMILVSTLTLAVMTYSIL
ncbi:hypothetical protein [Microvirga vignae]|nr:hypothetical protein [Microvirga vignae]